MANFADRLRALRLLKHETQKQIAELLSIAERNYRRYEAGEVDPSASNLSVLADHFNVSVDYLMGRTNYSMDADGRITVQVPPDILNLDTDELAKDSGEE